MTELIEIEVDEEPEAELEVIEAALKPETVGHGVPGWEAQTVRPEAGCVFSSFEMEGMPEPTAEETVTENGRYNVARLGFLKVQVPQPAGEVELTENRDYDVSGYETAKVRVPQGVFPEGTLPITRNGVYNVAEYEAVNVQVEQSQEPVLLASVDVATLAESVNRVVFHPTDFDLSAFRSIYFVCEGVRFSAQDWLYFTVADATAYTSKMLNIGTKILCFARMGTNWACAVKFATPNAYDNAGNRLGLGDIAIYPYSAATKFVTGTVKLYGL